MKEKSRRNLEMPRSVKMPSIEMGTIETKMNFGGYPRVLKILKLTYLRKKWR